jgi:hypothetical protein
MMNLIYAKDKNNFYKETEKWLITITDEQLPTEFKQEDWYVSYRQSNNNIQENKNSQPTINTQTDIKNTNSSYIDPKAVVGTNYTISLANQSSTENIFEVDIIMTVNWPQQWVALLAPVIGIRYNTDILNWGIPCSTNNCWALEYIWGRSKEINTLGNMILRHREIPTNRGEIPTNQFVVMFNPGWATPMNLKPWTYSLGRYRFTNIVPWKSNSDAKIRLQSSTSSVSSASRTIILSYPFNETKGSYAYTTSAPSNAPWVTLTYTESSPYSVPLNTK